jgi:hypothetical protein
MCRALPRPDDPPDNPEGGCEDPHDNEHDHAEFGNPAPGPSGWSMTWDEGRVIGCMLPRADWSWLTIPYGLHQIMTNDYLKDIDTTPGEEAAIEEMMLHGNATPEVYTRGNLEFLWDVSGAASDCSAPQRAADVVHAGISA